ncbi:hypothetical protein FRX31_032878 [Thalictrum thalictroides]|uniref:CCHC-type domain-containing protein n=1 Tax=Thalictrum thalictroides TaxID=46969 RepID=A0A7J6UZT7_THATH|nr:hypothetical protein FRX31_032878 [Thalictrum thalictroides]
MASTSHSVLGSQHEDTNTDLEPIFAEKLTLPSNNPPAPLLEIPDISNHLFNYVVFGKIIVATFVPDHLVKLQLQQQWNLPHEVLPLPVGKGIFRFDLESEAEKNFVLNEGPWLVGGHFMSFQSWKPDTAIDKLSFQSLSVWVQIYGLPLERFNWENGLNLGRRIGKTMEVDDFNHFGEFGSFLRIKILIDARLPLPNGIDYLDQAHRVKHFPIRIEKLNFFCFNCGKLGHEKVRCGDRFSINPKESNLVRRRYSVAIKGFTPESRFHNWDWYTTKQMQNQNSEEDEPETESFDPIHPMQIEDAANGATTTPQARVTLSPSFSSISNSDTFNCSLSNGPISTVQTQPLPTTTCQGLTSKTSNLISIPVRYTESIRSESSSPNSAATTNPPLSISEPQPHTSKSTTTFSHSIHLLPEHSKVDLISPATQTTSLSPKSNSEIITLTQNHTPTTPSHEDQPAMVFKAQPHKQMSNSHASTNKTQISTQHRQHLNAQAFTKKQLQRHPISNNPVPHTDSPTKYLHYKLASKLHSNNMPRNPSSELIKPATNNINKVVVVSCGPPSPRKPAVKRVREDEDFNLSQEELETKRQKISDSKETDENFGETTIGSRNQHQIDLESIITLNPAAESHQYEEPNRKWGNVDDQSPALQEAIDILPHQQKKQKD